MSVGGGQQSLTPEQQQLQSAQEQQQLQYYQLANALQQQSLTSGPVGVSQFGSMGYGSSGGGGGYSAASYDPWSASGFQHGGSVSESGSPAGNWWVPPRWTRFMGAASLPLDIYGMFANYMNKQASGTTGTPDMAAGDDAPGFDPSTLDNPPSPPSTPGVSSSAPAARPQTPARASGRDPVALSSSMGTPYLSARDNPLLAGSTFGGSISYGLPNFGPVGGFQGGGGPYWHLLA